jgi:hypothetical protein
LFICDRIIKDIVIFWKSRLAVFIRTRKSGIATKEFCMKKVFFLVALIALTSISVFAQEWEQEQKPVNRGPVDFHLTFFNFGVEMHIPWTFEGSLDLMVLGIESRATGLGVEFSPAHLYGWIGQWAIDYTSKDDVHFEVGWSILNLTLFWNLMPLIASDVSYYLAPFVEFNYLVMSDTIHPEQFMLSAGLSVGRRRGDSVKYNSFCVEAGYRMIAHEITAIGGTPHRMFIGIKFGR